MSYSVFWGDHTGVHEAQVGTSTEAITVGLALRQSAPYGVAIVENRDGYKVRIADYPGSKGLLSDADLGI